MCAALSSEMVTKSSTNFTSLCTNLLFAVCLITRLLRVHVSLASSKQLGAIFGFRLCRLALTSAAVSRNIKMAILVGDSITLCTITRIDAKFQHRNVMEIASYIFGSCFLPYAKQEELCIF